MTSTWSNKTNLLTLKNYLHSPNQQLQRTPERSLEQSYQAVLRIKGIEDEYLNGGKISTESTNHTASVISYLQTNLEKNLNLAKLRLIEFKVSSFVLSNLNANHLAKLRRKKKLSERFVAPEHRSSPSALATLKTMNE